MPLAAAVTKQYDVLPERCVPIDLRSCVTTSFADEKEGDRQGGWFDQGTNDFRAMPLGRQFAGGVPFDIIDPAKNGGRSCIVLRGGMRPYFPASVEGIRVDGKFSRLFFLHTAAWAFTGRSPGCYRIRYENGQQEEFRLVGSVNIGDWWNIAPLPEAKTGIVVTGSGGHTVGSYVAAWENPHPEDEVMSLDLLSPNSKVVPIVIGITAEELGARKILSWKTLRGYGWGKAVPSYRDGECEVRISGKTEAWAGFTCAPESGDGIFRLTPEEWKRAHLVFRINGGLDRYGNPKGGQSLKMTLRSRENGKEIASDSLNVSRFLEAKMIDSSPETFQSVSVPLREFRNTSKLKHTIGMVGFQFNGTGAVSGVIVRDFRLFIPENSIEK